MVEDLHLSLNQKYRDKFFKLAQLKGISMSELIGRWIDEKYDFQIETGKQLEEMLFLLQQKNEKQGLGNPYYPINNKKVQILKEDGSCEELHISTSQGIKKE